MKSGWPDVLNAHYRSKKCIKVEHSGSCKRLGNWYGEYMMIDVIYVSHANDSAWLDQCFSVPVGIRISTALATPLNPVCSTCFFAILKFRDTTSMLVSSNILNPLVQSLILDYLSGNPSITSILNPPETFLILGTTFWLVRWWGCFFSSVAMEITGE